MRAISLCYILQCSSYKWYEQILCVKELQEEETSHLRFNCARVFNFKCERDTDKAVEGSK